MDSENPYRTPDSALTDAPAPKGRNYVFRSPQGLSRVTASLLIVGIVLTLLTIVAMVMLQQILQHAVDHDLAQAELADALRSRGAMQTRLAMLEVLVLIVTYVIAGMWIYRVGCNARALGAKGIDDSPGWAVGWYFVPFMNLVRPFRAMNQIWLASADPARWTSMSTPILLRFWWAFWLIANILGNLVSRIPIDHNDPAALVQTELVLMLSEAVDLIAKIFFLVVVLRLTRSQLDQHDRARPAAGARLEPNFPPLSS